MVVRDILRSIAIAALVVLPGRVTFAQDTPITGARVTVIEKHTGGLSVTLENLRDAPLVMWEVGAVRPGSAEPVTVQTANFTHPGRYGPDSGPVAPGERRVVGLPHVNVAEYSAAVIDLAVFADGYYEGRAASAEKFRQRRQQQADDMRFWVGALQQMPPGSNEAIRAFLREQLARHAARPGAGESSVANNLRSLVTEDVQRSPGWVAGLMRHRLADLQEHLARVEQPLTSGPAWLAGSVVSVAVSSVPAPGGTLYALVENVSALPIEAIGLRYESGGMTADYATSVELRPGSGPILPSERREELLSITGSADGTRPDVTVSFVLFTDLSFEGRREERNELLRQRDSRAADAAFWIAVLSEAVLQPADKVLAFLESKKRERAVAMAGTRQGLGFTSDIDQAIARAKIAPGEVAALASHMVTTLERQRAGLIRHQAR